MPLVCKLKHDFWKSWLMIFFFFWKDDDLFFLKMNKAWPNAPGLQIDAWLLKILTFEEKMIFFFFFFKMDEAWPYAPSLEMDAWFLEILIDFFWKDDDDDLFFWKWMRHGRMPLV